MTATPSKNKVLEIYGVPQTNAALLSWKTHVEDGIQANSKEIERIVRRSIQRVLKTGTHGRSFPISFPPSAPMTRTMRTNDLPLPPGKRNIPGGGSPSPFKGTGELSNSVKVKARLGKALSAKAGGEKNKQLFNIEASVASSQKIKAYAIIHGSAVIVTEKMRRLFAAAKVRYVPKVGNVLITPPRDFLAAGVHDAMPRVEKIMNKTITKANLKTMGLMPAILKAPGSTMGAPGRDLMGAASLRRAGIKLSGEQRKVLGY